jgi:hypothetical protein
MEDTYILGYFMAICSIFRQFGIFCGHLVYFHCFGIMYDEKSGNPALETKKLFIFSPSLNTTKP